MTTQVKLTNEGSADLTVTGGAVSTVLHPGDAIQTNVSSTVSLTVTAGASASSLKTRNYGPNSILIVYPNASFIIAPNYALEGDIAANASVTISEQP